MAKSLIAKCLIVALMGQVIILHKLNAETYHPVQLLSMIRHSQELAEEYPDSSLMIVRNVLQYASESGNDSLLMLSYRTFGEFYFNKSNHVLAIVNYFKALKIAESKNISQMQEGELYNFLFLYSRIATSYSELELPEFAREYFMIALGIIEEAEQYAPGSIPLFARISMLFNVGSLYLEEKLPEKAKEFFDEAERLNRDLNDSTVYANYLVNMGIYYKETDQIEESMKCYQEALMIANKLDLLLTIIKIHNNIGNIWLIEGDTDKAYEHFNTALKMGKNAYAWRSVKISATSLIPLYTEKIDYQKAFEMSELVRHLNDSLFSSETAQRKVRLALDYEFDKQLAISKLEQQAQWQQQRNQKLVLLSASLLLLILIFATGIGIRYFQHKAKLAHFEQVYIRVKAEYLKQENESITNTLDLKNQSLAERAIILIQKNELISAVAKQLKSLSEIMPEQCGDRLEQIINDLQKETDQNFWKEFQVRFSDVHQDFFLSLNQQFPNLTSSELKLAAFLKLNLSTKEIAIITYQSPESIKVARSRLRKKMGLTRNDNLVAFLNGI